MVDYLESIRSGKGLTRRQALSMIVHLSIPVILAQISSIIMQYIDASMVGHINVNASASIGLISTTTWLLGNMVSALAIGFYVQVAQQIGANQNQAARNIVRYGLITNLVLSLILMAISILIAGPLPHWLGGNPEINAQASAYFFVFAFTVPILAINYTVAGMLQSSGNMRVPSLLSILMCVLDVVFNFFLIFPTRPIQVFGRTFVVWGFNLGVVGAALGTLLAEIVAGGLMAYFLLTKSPSLHLRKEGYVTGYSDVLKRALKIALPVGVESIAVNFAYIAQTIIVSPLGTVAIAAHSFAVTAESLCYMPGYGIGAAATTIVGQSIGAGQRHLAIRLGWLSTAFGVALMTGTGILMYIFAPAMIGMLSPDPQVIELGARLLRIEAFVEPLYAASIVILGVFRGDEDTLVPGIMNLASMWLVRIPLAVLLVGSFGLIGVWIAMASELAVRGLIFIGRFWLKTRRTLKAV